MSKLVMAANGKSGKLVGVTLAYIKVNKPAEEHKGKRKYEAVAVVDEDLADEFKEKFSQSSVRTTKTADFEKAYGIPPIHPDAKKQYAITIRSNSRMSADTADGKVRKGDIVPYEWNSRPKVFVPTEGGVIDITMAAYGVANGSVGDIAFKAETYDGAGYGTLTGVLVTNLIKWELDGGAAFGDVVGQEGTAPVQQQEDDSTPPFQTEGEASKDSTEDGIGDGVDPFQMPDEN